MLRVLRVMRMRCAAELLDRQGTKECHLLLAKVDDGGKIADDEDGDSRKVWLASARASKL